MTTHIKFRNHVHIRVLRIGLPLFLSIGVFAIRSSAAECTVAALNGLKIPKMTITSAESVAAISPNPRYCDVKGSVETDGEGAGASSAGFEVMLPANWNSKFIFNGVGGLAGSLTSSANPVDRTLFLARGYATGITDTGHVNTDPTWEYSQPGEPNTPKIVDYFYRAVHQVTLAAKQLVKSYYGSSTISHSYFDGCSNGGKMGLIEATRYPDDYDGIIAGAPWLDPVGTSLWSLKNAKALLDGYIPLSLFPKVEAAVQKQCDKLDNVSDGLIQNPARCSFDPDALVPETLTQKQADALKLIIKPVKDQSGRTIYPGSSASNMGQFGVSANGSINELETPPADPTGSKPWGNAGMPTNWNLAVGIISNLGYYDSNTDLNNAIENNGVFKTAALKLIYDRMRADVPDDPAKLKPFLAKGGKLIIYHGYNDLVISPYRSVWFYEDLAKDNEGYENIQKQVRLFMVPGMQHCAGGLGPNVFDTLSPLENWVEKNVAPDAIVASHATNGITDRTMPLCKFPEQAKYRGKGDVKDQSNWSCPQTDRSLLISGPNGVQAASERHAAVVARTSAGAAKAQ